MCCVPQVEKSGLITGSRLGADNEYEFDELEVSERMHLTSVLACPDPQQRLIQGCVITAVAHGYCKEE